MDDVPVTPPTWGSEQTPQPAQPVQPVQPAPAASQPAVPDAGTVPASSAQDAFHEALEMRVAVYLQTTYGNDVLNEYLTLHEKDDLAELLMFEASRGINLQQLYQEQQASLLSEMEQRMPGSVAAITGTDQPNV